MENNSLEVNPESRGLLKENLAVQLREAILAGRILPGEKIIEGRWARQFGVAQVSIREALNIPTVSSLPTRKGWYPLSLGRRPEGNHTVVRFQPDPGSSQEPGC